MNKAQTLLSLIEVEDSPFSNWKADQKVRGDYRASHRVEKSKLRLAKAKYRLQRRELGKERQASITGGGTSSFIRKADKSHRDSSRMNRAKFSTARAKYSSNKRDLQQTRSASLNKPRNPGGLQ